MNFSAAKDAGEVGGLKDGGSASGGSGTKKKRYFYQGHEEAALRAVVQKFPKKGRGKKIYNWVGIRKELGTAFPDHRTAQHLTDLWKRLSKDDNSNDDSLHI